jgi:hypothetical protein
VSPGSNFNLSDKSLCRDKGTDIGLPFNGSAPDLGALEYEDIKVPASPRNLSIIIQ